MEKIKGKLKQPKVFNLSFVTAMSERFGYYIISFLIVLILKDIFKFSDSDSFKLCAIFIALGYLTPAIGGFLADKVIGIKRCLGLGLLLEMTGFILLALPSNNIFLFVIALGFIVIGAGIFKTAPTNMMGRAYEDNDPRIDSGFTLYYMGINIGSFSSSLIAGPVKDAYGWGIPFAISAAGLFFGFIWFMFFKKHGDNLESPPGMKSFHPGKWFIVVICCILGVLASAMMMLYVEIGSMCFYVLSGLIFIYLIWEIIISPKEDKKKIMVCLILIFLAVGFFSLYYQLYQSVVLFLQRNVDRTLFGIDIPTPVFLGLNGLSVIILGPILALIYNFLEKRKKDLSITTKFPLGILIITLGFLILYVGTLMDNGTGKISCLWVIAYLIVYSLGELLIGALGVAMITRIAPAKMYGIMMGAWFFIGSGLSAEFSGTVASLAKVPPELLSNLGATMNIYGKAFLDMAYIGLAFALVGFILAPWLKKRAIG
ncbi:MAG: hypothetical protein A2X47_13560 [Lentisphaerae bacterium GWF2_38_69]|nr:MAG: hypothetical protein A2X47_13560 [Lentisphaerae bacterium GWF2_38_69]